MEFTINKIESFSNYTHYNIFPTGLHYKVYHITFNKIKFQIKIGLPLSISPKLLIEQVINQKKYIMPSES